MPYPCIKNKETEKFHDFAMPVYDMMTGTTAFFEIGLNNLDVTETYIKRCVFDCTEDDFVIVCPKEECSRIDKLNKSFDDLACFERQSRDKFLKLFDKGFYTEVIEYMKLKNKLVCEIHDNETEVLLKDIASIKTKLKELISLF